MNLPDPASSDRINSLLVLPAVVEDHHCAVFNAALHFGEYLADLVLAVNDASQCPAAATGDVCSGFSVESSVGFEVLNVHD